MALELNRQNIVARLEAKGWRLRRHGANHDVFEKEKFLPAIVPRHRVLSPGVARTIAKAAQWKV